MTVVIPGWHDPGISCYRSTKSHVGVQKKWINKFSPKGKIVWQSFQQCSCTSIAKGGKYPVPSNVELYLCQKKPRMWKNGSEMVSNVLHHSLLREREWEKPIASCCNETLRMVQVAINALIHSYDDHSTSLLQISLRSHHRNPIATLSQTIG